MKILRRLLLLTLLSTAPGLLLASEPVNINTADKQTLMELNGIGEKLAQAIIDYRQEHGDFVSLDALTEVKGIGPAILEKNRERLRVESPAD